MVFDVNQRYSLADADLLITEAKSNGWITTTKAECGELAELLLSPNTAPPTTDGGPA